MSLFRATAALLALTALGAAEAPYDALALRLELLDPAAMARAIDDLGSTFPGYPAAALRARLAALDQNLPALRQGVAAGDATARQHADAWLALQREALLANPLLGDRLLFVRRSAKAPRLGLPQNWQSNSSLPKTGYGNELQSLSPIAPDGVVTTVYKPAADVFVGDLELHPDGDRLLFSQSDPKQPWQVRELRLGDGSVKTVTPDMGADVDNYDACYLPGGDLLFTSTATMVAVPCVNGSSHVANLYRKSQDGAVRQLCFDQEHNWGPRILANGRVLFARWEYTDLVHSNSRRLMTMNPDGTNQTAYYGSGGYWPNSLFYARPIPGHPTQVVAIASGHHGVARMGELILLDPQRGTKDAEGVVQRIPGFGKKVERVVADRLVDGSWPRFLHPQPLGREDGTGSGRYFLVSCKPRPNAPWGLYLADVFDNLVLVKEDPAAVLFEPVPVAKRSPPPVIPDRVDPARKDAEVVISDLHVGPGLAGIPRGEVKALRVFTYVYGYRGMGGLYGTVGMDGPWDVRRILGTVPVEADGSAHFTIPANTPIALQPLDGEGKALQTMRSWFTGMPGEVVSCVGCHESSRTAPPTRPATAARRAPDAITPWLGPARGFSFAREVQPVLDASCIRCHAGASGQPAPDLRGVPLTGWTSKMSGHANKDFGGRFSVAYANLHAYVRHPGIESDMAVLPPMDFHADSTELVQFLKKGHQEVKLDAEAWSRIITWIDLNTPFHGDWATIAGDKACKAEDRRAEMRVKYANVDGHDTEAASAVDTTTGAAAAPVVETAAAVPLAAAPPAPDRPRLTLDLGDGVAMDFAWIPPGRTDLGGEGTGSSDDTPRSSFTVAQGYWLAVSETTNAQYQRFDPAHDSRREDKQGYQFGVEGYPLFQPAQPVVRVSWRQAMAFAAWVGQRTGRSVTLPSEGEWEYACRAGTATPFWYGPSGSDFAAFANLADRTTRAFASDPYTEAKPISDPPVFDDWLPKDARSDDHALVSAPVRSYRPNPWGLYDMHGNAAEWTRSAYRPYPYAEDDGRNDPTGDALRVVRGGSWRDRPGRSTAAYRLAYRPYQPVFNVGFRLLLRGPGPGEAAR